jgi:hypothetical protein
MHPIGPAARLKPVIRFLALCALATSLGMAQPPNTPLQTPKIGEINFYGLRKLTPEKILSTLALRPGDPLPPSKGDLEERLAEMSGVLDARVEAVCCEGSTAVLFIGIEERGAPHFDTRPAPSGAAVLTDELLEQYRDFLAANARGQSDEARRLEQTFTAFAADNVALLRDVIRNSSEPDHRAAAAALIAYAPPTNTILNDLQFGLQDPEESVRAAAARSLKAMAVLARKNPAIGLKIAPVWFVEMLNSPALGDRVQATSALTVLTDQPNPPALELLRERAMPALTEMARWKTLDYALPPFLLLGRAAGIPEADLLAQWEKGDRETAIRKATQRK